MTLLLLEMITLNAFFGLLFRWKFDYLVYGTHHKVWLTYAAILSTFIVQAAFADVTTEGKGFNIIIVFIEALLANALLFPVRLILPYMLVNTHSIVSATEYRKTGLSARLKTCLKLTGRRHKSVESVVPQKQVRITWTL